MACDSLPELCLSLYAVETSGGIISRNVHPSPPCHSHHMAFAVCSTGICNKMQCLALTLKNLGWVEMQIIYAHGIKSLEGGPENLDTGKSSQVILMQLNFKYHWQNDKEFECPVEIVLQFFFVFRVWKKFLSQNLSLIIHKIKAIIPELLQ